MLADNQKLGSPMIKSALVYIVSLSRLPLLWVAVFGTLGLNMLLSGVDQLIVPGSNASQPDMVQSIQQQIEQGADPSTILPATATGGSLKTVSSVQTPQNCSRGSMDMTAISDAPTTRSPYVSTRFGNQIYGQIMTVPPQYFVQYSHQEVTLTKIDRLPPDAALELERALRKLSDCQRKEISIQAVLSSEYLRDRDT